MEATLRKGTTLVVDCYSYSGVTLTAAKGLDLLDLTSINGVKHQTRGYLEQIWSSIWTFDQKLLYKEESMNKSVMRNWNF